MGDSSTSGRRILGHKADQPQQDADDRGVENLLPGSAALSPPVHGRQAVGPEEHVEHGEIGRHVKYAPAAQDAVHQRDADETAVGVDGRHLLHPPPVVPPRKQKPCGKDTHRRNEHRCPGHPQQTVKQLQIKFRLIGLKQQQRGHHREQQVGQPLAGCLVYDAQPIHRHPDQQDHHHLADALAHNFKHSLRPFPCSEIRFSITPSTPGPSRGRIRFQRSIHRARRSFPPVYGRSRTGIWGRLPRWTMAWGWLKASKLYFP